MYFAVKAEYHSKGTLFMIDKTALVLGKLKDDIVNYRRKPNSYTIHGTVSRDI